jgi:hypothetical protein
VVEGECGFANEKLSFADKSELCKTEFSVVICTTRVAKGAHKSSAFPIFLTGGLQHNQQFLDGLKMLEQRSHKCMEPRRNM